jgi:hypothetical protein
LTPIAVAAALQVGLRALASITKKIISTFLSNTRHSFCYD